MHVVIIVPDDATTTDDVQVYINNSAVTGERNGGSDRTLDTGSSDVYLGRRFSAGGQEHFDGAVDDVRIYDRALTAAEVEDLYELGRRARRRRPTRRRPTPRRTRDPHPDADQHAERSDTDPHADPYPDADRYRDEHADADADRQRRPATLLAHWKFDNLVQRSERTTRQQHVTTAIWRTSVFRSNYQQREGWLLGAEFDGSNDYVPTFGRKLASHRVSTTTARYGLAVGLK